MIGDWSARREGGGVASVHSYLTLWDMCSGVSISSKMAPLTLEPRRLASCRSQPERSQFYERGTGGQKMGTGQDREGQT